MFIQELSSLIRSLVEVVSFSFFAVPILGGNPQPLQNDQSQNNVKVDDVMHEGVDDDDIVTYKLLYVPNGLRLIVIDFNFYFILFEIEDP